MRRNMRKDGKQYDCTKKAMALIKSCNCSQEVEVGFPSGSDDIKKAGFRVFRIKSV
jgi:hypothetical protein